MVRLIAPNGAKVDVAEDKVDRLKGQGFTDGGDDQPKARAKRAPRTKADEK